MRRVFEEEKQNVFKFKGEFGAPARAIAASV
jgi:hypothetical protein